MFLVLIFLESLPAIVVIFALFFFIQGVDCWIRMYFLNARASMDRAKKQNKNNSSWEFDFFLPSPPQS